MWVLNGEGIATIKWNGTCTMLAGDGTWWARREVKPGKPIPEDYWEEELDPVTGKRVGWEPMAQSSFAKFHAEALELESNPQPGTYELVGPKIQGNPSGFQRHLLIRHGWAAFTDREDAAKAPRSYDGLREWLYTRPHEGLVFHHPDGCMVKIKKRDFQYGGEV